MTWGSAHPGGFHMVFCDGAASVNYDIDQQVHNQLSNRHEDTKIDLDSWQKWISGQMPKDSEK